MICPYCKKELKEGYIFCTKCGNRIDGLKDSSLKETSTSSSPRKINKKTLAICTSAIAITIAVVVICVVVVIRQTKSTSQTDEIQLDTSDEETENRDVEEVITTEEKTVVSDETEKEEVTEEEISEPVEVDQGYLVDYMVLGRLLYYSTNNFETFDAVLADDDEDGYNELYMTVYCSGGSEYNYAVNSFITPYIVLRTGYSGASEYNYMISGNDNKVYLKEGYYAAATGGEWYYLFKDNDWNMLGGMNYEAGDDGPVYSYKWEGKDTDENTLNANVESLSLRDIDANDKTECVGFVSYDSSLSEVSYIFENHMGNRGVDYVKLELDLDSDGSDEIVYAVNDYFKAWTNTIPSDSNISIDTSNPALGNNLLFLIDESDGETCVYPMFQQDSIVNMMQGTDCDIEIEYSLGTIRYDYSEYLEEAFIQPVSEIPMEGYGDEPDEVVMEGYGDEPY